MVLAVWIGARVGQVHYSPWILIGLLIAWVLSVALRASRRTSITVLAGSAILSIWVVPRFVMPPAFILVAAAWLACKALNLAAAAALLNAMALLAVYGGGAILATSVLANLAAAIKGPLPGSSAAK